mmetsp:Transcript_12606/g.11148  ORF Transcript_12606/g.11148 Transcript_12606/m.11148 type:complete len:117 (+) Transcript_12606:323-673(+)
MLEIVGIKNIGESNEEEDDLDQSDEEGKEEEEEKIDSRYFDQADGNVAAKNLYANRVLKFLLTDGETKLIGFENSLIRSIPSDVAIGDKIIVGPGVEARMGHIFMDSKNTIYFKPS